MMCPACGEFLNNGCGTAQKRQHMAIIMWRNVAGITDIAISIQKSGATVKERGHTRSKGLYHQADM